MHPTVVFLTRSEFVIKALFPPGRLETLYFTNEILSYRNRRLRSVWACISQKKYLLHLTTSNETANWQLIVSISVIIYLINLCCQYYDLKSLVLHPNFIEIKVFQDVFFEFDHTRVKDCRHMTKPKRLNIGFLSHFTHAATNPTGNHLAFQS